MKKFTIFSHRASVVICISGIPEPLGPSYPAVEHISPEAALGGPIALVETGDMIKIDIPERKIDIVGINGRKAGEDKINNILEGRRSRWSYKAPKRKGVLSRYTSSAVSAMKGGYMMSTDI